MRHASYPRLEYQVLPIGSLSARQVLAVEQSLLNHTNPLLRRVSVLPPPVIIEAPVQMELATITTTATPKAARKPGKPKKTNGKRRLTLH